jgi:hypothetical protein
MRKAKSLLFATPVKKELTFLLKKKLKIEAYITYNIIKPKFKFRDVTGDTLSDFEREIHASYIILSK